jgi:hypothetical protein
MTTDEQTMKTFAKILLIGLIGFAALFCVVGAALSMLLH